MIALLMKVTVVVAIGLAIATFVRGMASDQRHLVLLGAIVAALLLPLGIAVSPRWNAPILPARQSAQPPLYYSPTVPALPSVTLASRPVLQGAELHTTSPSLPSPKQGARLGLIATLWALGALAVLVWIAAGHLRIALVTRRAWVANAREWTSLRER